MTEQKIRTNGPVTLTIDVGDDNPAVCHEDCCHIWTEEIPGKTTMKAMCIFGRLRWRSDGSSTYRHETCLAAKPVKGG